MINKQFTQRLKKSRY